MKATVIVPTFNRAAALRRTLEALHLQVGRFGEFEVVVVDDCSGDETEEVVAAAKNRGGRVRYMRHPRNMGRAVTRNDGILAASGDIVIFLDDDNVPGNDFVRAHVECHEKVVAEHVAVMGNVSFADESIAGSNFARYVNEQYLGNRPRSARQDLDYENLPARCFGTLNASVRREDAIRVGMFDTEFRHYGGEDVSLGFALRRSGIRICYAEGARTVHYDEVSIARYRLKYEETAREGFRIIARRSPGFIDETAVRFLMPIAWRADGAGTIGMKILSSLALSEPVVRGLEWWANRTDRWPACASRRCFRALLAGWHRRGLRTDQLGRSEVTYGPLSAAAKREPRARVLEERGGDESE